MDNHFEDNEKVYRAVYPPEVADIFWKRDGSISSAAFADPRGLSVDRGNYRSEKAVIISMQKRFQGRIITLYSKHCKEAGAVLRYAPSKSNPYHSEIHGNASTPLLSKSQRRYLARKAAICY